MLECHIKNNISQQVSDMSVLRICCINTEKNYIDKNGILKMNNKAKAILSSIFLSATLGAVETTLTNISFIRDDNGQLNPYVFIPFYYGEDNRFYSAVGYSSSSLSEIDSVSNTDSKGSHISQEQTIVVNYLTYNYPVSNMLFSIGIQSEFTKVNTSEFAYVEEGGAYLAVDNDVEAKYYRHSIELQAMVPLGSYVKSRLSLSISPYSTLDVEQDLLIKYETTKTPSHNKDSQTQNISYGGVFELQTETGTFVNFGLLASYYDEPLKYKAVGDTTVDNNEVTTRYIAKVIIGTELLGGLNPSLGFGVENIDVKNNLDGSKQSYKKNIITFGVEKRF